MAKKSSQPLVHPTPGKVGPKKGGRPPSEKALKYVWFREIEGFRTCSVDPWWGDIEWDEVIKAHKAKRSISPRGPNHRIVHAGFLWEAVRRQPDFQQLLAGYRRLSGKDPMPRDLPEGCPEFVMFMKENGMPVVDALEILLKHWKQDFGHVPQQAKDEWQACYLAIWNKVGKRGSVPTAPAELPKENDTGHFSWQGRTAFDLLVCRPSDGPRRYDELPLPSLFLEAFAEFRPVSKRSERGAETALPSADGVSETVVDLVLNFGFLEQHLKTNNMHPIALAVDLSKSTDSILRDLRKVIDAKRNSLGICVADRRIKLESFKKIQTLDREVFGDEGAPPLSKTVNEFEDSVQIDLFPLIDSFESLSCDDSSSAPQQEKPSPSEIRRMLSKLKKSGRKSPAE